MIFGDFASWTNRGSRPLQFFEDFYKEIEVRLRDADPISLDAVFKMFIHAQQRNRKVILGGNGGSAAIASHVSVDLTKAARVRSICFNESDLITCFANDYGYEHWLAKAIECYGDAGDAVVLISSSGRSLNIVNAARSAKERGLTVVTMSGFDASNPLRALGDQNLWVNSRSYNIVETVHQIWLLACVDKIALQLQGINR